jgi:hypothetical protein
VEKRGELDGLGNVRNHLNVEDRNGAMSRHIKEDGIL